MSAKVANLIAVELGILIAILSALTVSSFRNAHPARVARGPVRAIEAFAPVAPSRQLRQPAVNYPAEDLIAEPLSDKAPVDTAQAYEQPTSTEAYPDYYGPDDGYIAESAPNYDDVDPLLTTSDCFLPPVTQYVVYRQPSTFVVFSNSRSSHGRFSGRQPRSRDRLTGGGMRMPPRRPPMQQARPRGTTMAPRRPTVQPPRSDGRRTGPRSDVQIQSSRPSPQVQIRQRR